MRKLKEIQQTRALLKRLLNDQKRFQRMPERGQEWCFGAASVLDWIMGENHPVTVGILSEIQHENAGNRGGASISAAWPKAARAFPLGPGGLISYMIKSSHDQKTVRSDAPHLPSLPL